jgi:hypothetical protein
MFMHTLRIRSLSLVVLFAVACRPVAEITPRKFVGLIVGHTAVVKAEVAKSLIAKPGQSVPQAGVLKISTPAGLAPMKFDFGWVTTSGTIVIQSKDYGVIIVQEPSVQQDTVKWSCVVHSAEAKPELCGS